MSDFTNGFWPWYVAAISLVSILACAWLLWVAGKAKVSASRAVRSGERQHHRPCVGRGLAGAEQPAAFVVDVAVHSDRGFALGYLVIFPGLGSFQGC